MPRRTEPLLLPPGQTGQILEWKVKKGVPFYAGQTLCRVRLDSGGVIELKAAHDGWLKEQTVPKGPISPGEPAGQLDICDHAVQWQGLCVDCGRDARAQHFSRSNVQDTPHAVSSRSQPADLPFYSPIYQEPRLTVNRETARRLEMTSVNRLLRARKLSLVLDLDHTLVHATTNYHQPIDSPDMHTFNLPGDPFKYVLKVRPGALQMLHALADHFEYHLYSMGTRHYVTKIASLLDPEKKFFEDRVLSREDTLTKKSRVTAKDLQRVFPCDWSMVLILDDRADVWGESKNLLQIPPYHYFKGGEVNPRTAPTPSHPPAVPGTNTTSQAAAVFQTPASHRSSASSQAVKPVPFALPSEDAKQVVGTRDGEDGHMADAHGDDGGVGQDEPPPESSTAAASRDGLSTAVASSADRPASAAADANEKDESAAPTHLVGEESLDPPLVAAHAALNVVHSLFYRSVDRNTPRGQLDVRTILQDLRSTILAGVHCVFSGLIPLNAATPPQAHPLWQLALSAGAECHFNTQDGVTTHVIAANRTTEKVRWARQHGVLVVKVAWLHDSVGLWRKQNESSSKYGLADGADGEQQAEQPPSASTAPHLDTTVSDLRERYDALLLAQAEQGQVDAIEAEQPRPRKRARKRLYTDTVAIEEDAMHATSPHEGSDSTSEEDDEGDDSELLAMLEAGLQRESPEEQQRQAAPPGWHEVNARQDQQHHEDEDDTHWDLP